MNMNDINSYSSKNVHLIIVYEYESGEGPRSRWLVGLD